MEGSEDEDRRTGEVLELGAYRELDQRALDGKIVRRQAAALGRNARAEGFQRRITDLIRSRRAGSDDPAVEQFDLHEGHIPGGAPLLSGALLVRAALPHQDPDLFGALVAEVGAAQSRLDDRLLVLGGSGVSPERLVELARQVRCQGYEASVDHIVPLNIVAKGEGGPARTLLARAVPAPVPVQGAVRLALLDTGVAAKDRVHDWQLLLEEPDNQDPCDAYPLPKGDGLLDAAAGHGAFATGIVQQVDPTGAVRVHRAIDSDGIGSEVRVAEELLLAVREHGAEIVNLSLGTQTVDDQPLLALQVAFELLSEGGHDDVLLVAAAGNYGDTRPCWPAAFRRVVAVAALTADLEPAAWSSRGFWVDVSTVGEGLVSTYVRGEESPDLSPGTGNDDWPMNDPRPWAVWTGTSFAAPQVAAEVARRLTARRAGGDAAATPRTVLAELLGEGRRLPDYGVALRILSGTPVTR